MRVPKQVKYKKKLVYLNTIAKKNKNQKQILIQKMPRILLTRVPKQVLAYSNTITNTDTNTKYDWYTTYVPKQYQ